MGNVFFIVKHRSWDPERIPNAEKHATFDPLYGFPKGRKERKIPATYDELISAGIRQDLWDVCVDKRIVYDKCRLENAPWYPACIQQKHDLEECDIQDYIHRLKEYERERRLLCRAQRKKRKALAEAGPQEQEA